MVLIRRGVIFMLLIIMLGVGIRPIRTYTRSRPVIWF